MRTASDLLRTPKLTSWTKLVLKNYVGPCKPPACLQQFVPAWPGIEVDNRAQEERMDHRYGYLSAQRLPNNANNAKGTWGKNARSNPSQYMYMGASTELQLQKTVMQSAPLIF